MAAADVVVVAAGHDVNVTCSASKLRCCHRRSPRLGRPHEHRTRQSRLLPPPPSFASTAHTMFRSTASLVSNGGSAAPPATTGNSATERRAQRFADLADRTKFVDDSPRFGSATAAVVSDTVTSATSSPYHPQSYRFASLDRLGQRNKIYTTATSPTASPVSAVGSSSSRPPPPPQPPTPTSITPLSSSIVSQCYCFSVNFLFLTIVLGHFDELYTLMVTVRLFYL